MAYNKKDFKREMKRQSKKYSELAKIQRKREREKLRKQKDEGDFIKKFDQFKSKLKRGKREENERNDQINRDDRNDQTEQDVYEQDQSRLEEMKRKIKRTKKDFEKIKAKARRKSRNRKIQLAVAFLLPTTIIVIGMFSLFMLVSAVNNAGIVATIAGIANPTERARLKAMKLLGNEQVVQIPENLIGAEPDLKGTSSYKSAQDRTGENSASSDNSKNGNMNQNAYSIYLHYKGKLTDQMICGILGCFEEESKINPHVFEANYVVYGSSDEQKEKAWQKALPLKFNPVKIFGADWVQRIYGGGINPAAYDTPEGPVLGLGLGQWTGPRGLALLKYAGEDKVGNLGTQLDFMDKVDKRYGYDGTKNWKYWAHGDASAETRAWCVYWEGFSLPEGIAKRMVNARNWEAKIKDGSIKVSLPK